MYVDRTKLWMGLGLFVAGLLVIASAWVGEFSGTQLVFGGIPAAIGVWLMLK